MTVGRIASWIGTMGVLAAAGACFGSSGGPPDAGDASAQPDTPPPDDGPAPHTDAGAETAAKATNDAAADATVSEAAPDASPSSDAPAEGAAEAGGAGSALIRVADMAFGLPSSIDFCVAGAEGPFVGPYLAGQGVASGIPYRTMSEYAAYPASTSFTVRVVPAGSSGCSAGLVADVITGPLDASTPTTVVLAGGDADAGVPLTFRPFADDLPSTSPRGNRTRFRVLHEAPGLGAASFQMGASPYVMPLQTGVAYGTTFDAARVTPGAPAPDAQGYVEPGLGSEQVELVLGGVETLSFYVNANNATDSVTAFLVGKSGDPADPLGFVACDEIAPPSGHLAACAFSSTPPATIPTRVLHAAPDQGAIDACVQVGTLPTGPALLAQAGVAGGLGFLQVSGDLTAIPAGTDFGVAFAPTGSTCATSSFATIGSSIHFGELTVTLSEATLPPSTTYQQYLFDTGQGSNPTNATLTVASLGPSGGPLYDVSYVVVGAGAELLGSEGPGDSNGALLAAGTYGLQVAVESAGTDAAATPVYARAGAQFAAGEEYFLGWFDATTPSPGALVDCVLGSRAANAVTTCTD
jgi:hypothetical protein